MSASSVSTARGGSRRTQTPPATSGRRPDAAEERRPSAGRAARCQKVHWQRRQQHSREPSRPRCHEHMPVVPHTQQTSWQRTTGDRRGPHALSVGVVAFSGLRVMIRSRNVHRCACGNDRHALDHQTAFLHCRSISLGASAGHHPRWLDRSLVPTRLLSRKTMDSGRSPLIGAAARVRTVALRRAEL